MHTTDRCWHCLFLNCIWQLRRMDRTSSGKKCAYCAVMKDRRAISTFTLIKNVYIFQTVTDICMIFKHLIIKHKTAHWQFLKVQWGSRNISLSWRKVFKCLNFIWQTWYLKYRFFNRCFCPWVFGCYGNQNYFFKHS